MRVLLLEPIISYKKCLVHAEQQSLRFSHCGMCQTRTNAAIKFANSDVFSTNLQELKSYSHVFAWLE
jgi:hypothetical protein